MCPGTDGPGLTGLRLRSIEPWPLRGLLYVCRLLVGIVVCAVVT